MSGTAEPASLPGSARVLMMSTVVMAASAAAVLALGTQDARLLRLGVVAALWAALLAAFTTARARREVSSRAEHADQLRAVYQLELQREVVARREHALAVERALREQAQLSQQREIGQLRAELAAIGGNLAQLAAAATTSTPAIASVATPAAMPTARGGATSRDSLAGPGFPGPVRPEAPNSYGQGRHGVPSWERSGPNNNGSSNNGGGAAQAQRTVQDLLAAHGPASTPRRGRTHKDGTAASA
ncbi:MAG: hypothetical protein DLM61_10590 [Pseudonocardiales bacterium]|nr:hypothetical protein [Pseudonocardiales bacterium]PZS30526.1 MAG: hypothetical protein DLM61_10590 [Pseudonocardiales bacterium]